MGKQHGGLARAGKVKNATPKVAVTEKDKPKVGRAKKRAQYNKRCKQSVTSGRKSGPNAQNKPIA